MKHARELSSYEEIDPEFMEPEQAVSGPRRRGPGAGTYVFAILFAGVVPPLGIYTWQLSREKGELAVELEGAAKALQEAEQRALGLATEREQQKALAEQLASERDLAQTALADNASRLSALEAANAASDAQLAELRDMRAKFQRMIDSGALDISVRRGRMIVEMPAAVLFDSGSAELSPAGAETVKAVAKVLRNVPRHRFLVGGHTDNVPAVKQYKSNWDLSAARAVRVTETLTASGVAPSRLVIAGYSEFDPIAKNSSEAGRQKNRRIEIILEPYVEQKLVEGMLAAKAPPPKGK